MIAIVDTDAYI